MDYKDITEFKDALLEYLEDEKQFTELDILANENLNDTEKIENGLLVESATVLNSMPPYYDLQVSENNTKLRPGDNAILTNGTHSIKVKIIENTSDVISVESAQALSNTEVYRLEVRETVMLQSIINLAQKIEDGMAGAYWVKTLAGIYEPRPKGVCCVNPRNPINSNLNPEQRQAIENVLPRPSLYCIQGPPGTGKTDVLSLIVAAFATDAKPYEVLVLSNSHQAVNNALNKIRKQSSAFQIVKVGEVLKAEGLDDSITICNTYSEYLKSRKGRTANRDIVGMTYHAAVCNLGLRSSGFCPSVAIIDEAGQMPFVYGALIGLFGCSSNIFIGDDRQMPPIFHPQLENHPLSQSIFTFLTQKYPDFKTTLTTTYRMNDEITELVSRNFYEPWGVKLVASDYSAKRRLQLNSNHSDSIIQNLLTSEQSVHKINVSKHDCWKDYNLEEASFTASLVKEALDCGMESKDIAVITPYRRQVKAIREEVNKILPDNQTLPLIDTVERLQGQDVEIIIISMCATNPLFLKGQEHFIFNPNRLNVMISRAKTKVIILNCLISGNLVGF